MPEKIELGQKVIDKMTHFRGVATARCVYLDGATLFRVEAAWLGGEHSLLVEWVEEDRLIVDK